MNITKIKETHVLSDNLVGMEFQVRLEINYLEKNWSINTNYGNDKFIFQNTRNYYASQAVCNLIKSATSIAREKLGLKLDECIPDEDLPF